MGKHARRLPHRQRRSTSTTSRVVNPQASRSIIVLSPEERGPGRPGDQDRARAHARARSAARSRTAIVAEIQDPKNLEAARLVGGDEAVIVDKSRDDLAADRADRAPVGPVDRLHRAARLRRRRDLLPRRRAPARQDLRRRAARLRGVLGDRPPVPRTSASRSTRRSRRVIEPGVHLIAIAEDDEKLLGAAVADRRTATSTRRDRDGVGAAAEPQARARARLEPPRPLGDRRVRQLPRAGLDDDGRLVATPTSARRSSAEARELANLEVEFFRGDTTDRRTLEPLRSSSYDHVIVLCYSDQLDAQRADARTLVTLLHLREIASHDRRRSSRSSPRCSTSATASSPR